MQENKYNSEHWFVHIWPNGSRVRQRRLHATTMRKIAREEDDCGRVTTLKNVVTS